MRIQCPYSECLGDHSRPFSERLIRRGTFKRKSDSERIPRFICRACGRWFSSSHLLPTFLQKKRKLNRPLLKLLNSGVSQRRAARFLGISRQTVERKFKFLAEQARISQNRYQEKWRKTPLTEVQFDDLETSEHSKCKPLSVALAVDPKTRKILSFQVSQMPCKGRLAHVARLKYGYRKDERSLGWTRLFSALRDLVHDQSSFLSDENPHYPRHLKSQFPNACHETVKGGRGCIAGQGELKKLHFDPLFSLNHTCAMMRANMNRLFRRTWCTTKKREGLIDHLSLYVDFHNRVLTEKSAA
ncbi:MAG: transposase [Proteobacteria bacterium]|nr:MAG: transposase [Pseudomonadota bacterium]